MKTRAIRQIEQESERATGKELEDGENPGLYKDRQAAFGRADLMKKSSGDEIRLEIKRKCEWESIFLD